MADDIFIDTNILVYLVDEDSKFHKNTLKKLKSFNKNSKFWISRQVIREYATITTRSDLISNPLSTDQLVADIKKFSQIYNITDESEKTTEQLIILLCKYQIKGKQIHDANIVASMLEFGISVLFTNNISDFKRYDEIELISLDKF